MFDPTEPIDEEENGLTGRINSDLSFEEAVKRLLNPPTRDDDADPQASSH
jgi:hypothetical protein